MQIQKNFLIILILFIVSLIGIQFLGFSSALKDTNSVLTNSDCIKCHQKEVSFVNTSGGKHQLVGCLGCHEGHFPQIPKEKMIPSCNKCHAGKEHYTLENCLKCHQNPHTPLNISFEEKELKKECASCHKDPFADMEKYPSKHKNLNCNFCHLKHKEKLSCLNCHKGHLKEQTLKDCLSCHKPHKPLIVTYEQNIPNNFCTACHEKVGLALEYTKTKHGQLACAFCHRGQHKVIPTCETCHGQPHPASMIIAFKSCLDCHNDPHNLIK